MVRVLPHYNAGSAAESEAERAALRQERQQVRLEAEKVKTAFLALQQASDELAGLRQRFLQEAEGQLVELALNIARKVLMQEIQAGRYQIDPIVKEALLSIPSRQNVVVRLNPDDLAGCELAGMEPEGGDGGSLRFVADPNINRAECLIEAADGMVESSIDAHLDGVAEALGATEGQS